MEVDRGKGMWVFNNQLLRDRTYITTIENTIEDFKHQLANNNYEKRFWWDIRKQKIKNFRN